MAWKKLNPKNISKENNSIYTQYIGKLSEAAELGEKLKAGLESAWKKQNPNKACHFKVFNGAITYTFPKAGKEKNEGDDIF